MIYQFLLVSETTKLNRVFTILYRIQLRKKDSVIQKYLMSILIKKDRFSVRKTAKF